MAALEEESKGVPADDSSSAPDLLLNEACVFLKPHADNDACEALLRSKLEAAGCSILSARRIPGEEIDASRLIDAHYGSLAECAMVTDPESVKLTPEKEAAFLEMFGVAWKTARKLRNPVALAELQVDGLELEKRWRAGSCLKLAPGTYVAKLIGGAPGASPLFTINGFYPAMRQEFVAPGSAVRVFDVAWSASHMSWAHFRDVLVGATDPTTADTATSLRGAFFERWEELGLARQPAISCNCVHASAGPLEGLKEREVWIGASVADGLFRRKVAAKIPEATLDAWLDQNPAVALKEGEKPQKIFDATEGLDAQELLDLL